MFAFVLGEQDASVVQLGEEIGVERAGGSWQPEHPDHIAYPALHQRVHLNRPRALLSLPAVELPDKALAVVVFREFKCAMIKGRGPVIVRVKGKCVLVTRLHSRAPAKEPELVAGIVRLLPVSLDLLPQRLLQREANVKERGNTQLATAH